MIKSRNDSHLEIWSYEYINNPQNRRPIDRESIVIQIEPTNDDKNFIVEIYNRKGSKVR